MNKTDRLHHITTFLLARRRTTLAELQAETGALIVHLARVFFLYASNERGME